MNDTEEIGRPKPRPAAWKLIGLGVLVVVLAGQSAVLVLQNQRIGELERRAPIPGPTGPTGPQGPAGPMGPQGFPGAPGVSAPNMVTGATTMPTQQMSELDARAHCTQLAQQAWPDSTNSDPTLQQLGQAYTLTMRQKAFDSCMTQEGYPQPG